MDLQLPGVDGLETCTCLKSDPQTAAIPIVALTSCAMPGDQKRAKKSGCDGYSTTPVETQRLVSRISLALPLQ
jgi:CheY-like chemotaxis protein